MRKVLLGFILLVAARSDVVGRAGARAALDSHDRGVMTMKVDKLTPAEKEVLAADASWGVAYQNCDLKSMDRLLSDDLVFIHLHGKLDRKPYMMEEFSKCQNESTKTEQITLTMRGDTAIVVGNVKIYPKGQGQKPPLLLLYTNVFAKHSGAWKMISHQSTTNWLQTHPTDIAH